MSKGGNALKGAGSGALAGSQFGVPGAVIGGVAGGLLGLFGGSDEPEYSLPDLESLRLSNPELYDQFMQMKYIQNDAMKALRSRQAGINSAEQIQMDDARSNLRSQQANRGLAGSSAAVGQQADMANRMMAQQQNRALQEEMQRRAQIAQMSGQFTNNYMNVMSPQAQANYGQQQADANSMNQFFGGLAESGIKAYGNRQAMNWEAAENEKNRNAGYGGYYGSSKRNNG